MNTLRRLAAVGTVAAVVTIGGAPVMMTMASAAPAATQSPKCPKGHGNGNQYPPGQCKAKTNQSSVAPGGSVTVSDDGNASGEAVDVTLHSAPVHLATVTSSATGVATATVKIPASTTPGVHTLILDGRTSGNEMSVQITVAAPVSSTNSGLPFTGAAAAIPLTGAGIAMVLAGGLTLAGVRRRRRPTVQV